MSLSFSDMSECSQFFLFYYSVPCADIPSSVPKANPTGSAHIFWLQSLPPPAPFLAAPDWLWPPPFLTHLRFHSVNLPVAPELKSRTSGIFLMQTPDGREDELRASACVPTRSLLEAVLASSTQEKV